MIVGGGRVRPNKSSMMGIILSLTVTVGRKSPLTTCPISLVTKLLIVCCIKACLSFCARVHVMQNVFVPRWLQMKIEVIIYKHTH